MATAADPWFIRLPDGRVLRAKNAELLRKFLKTGRIPWDSRVRRAPDDPWQTLDRAPEFADLVPADSGPAEETSPAEAAPRDKPRSAGPDVRTLGVRGLFDELCDALDSSLQPAKLNTAGVTGLGIGVSMVAANAALILFPEWAWAVYLAAGFVVLVLFNICTSIITQMTALELSRFRPAHFSEVRAGIFGYVWRLTTATALVAGIVVGLIVLLRWLPAQVTPSDAANPGVAIEALLNLINGARLVLEVICWPILGFATLLMAPIFVVEDFSVLSGLRAWLGMFRQHLGRIYLYQAIAFAFAAVMTLPLLAPVLLAFGFAGGNPGSLSLGESVPFYLLVGVSLTPMLAYLLVAHVFVYLNLRYEFFYSARER